MRLVLYEGGVAQSEFVSGKVRMEPRRDAASGEPWLWIEAEKPAIQILSTGVSTERPQASFKGYYTAKEFATAVRDLPIEDLVELAKVHGNYSAVGIMKRDINHEILKVGRNIQSRIHERTALSVSCLGMLLLGSVLAIRLKTALPLTVYFWSFLPSMLGLILISTGADLVREVDDPVWVGTLVAWSGNLVMAVFVLVMLRKIART